jgi:hypothetical protein
MYNVAIAFVIAHKVGNDFAKSLWEQAFIYVFDGVMHIFFLATHPAFGVFVLHGPAKLRREGECKKRSPQILNAQLCASECKKSQKWFAFGISKQKKGNVAVLLIEF